MRGTSLASLRGQQPGEGERRWDGHNWEAPENPLSSASDHYVGKLITAKLFEKDDLSLPSFGPEEKRKAAGNKGATTSLQKSEEQLCLAQDGSSSRLGQGRPLGCHPFLRSLQSCLRRGCIQPHGRKAEEIQQEF